MFSTSEIGAEAPLISVEFSLSSWNNVCPERLSGFPPPTFSATSTSLLLNDAWDGSNRNSDCFLTLDC